MTLARRDEPTAEATRPLHDEPSAQNIITLAQHFIGSGYFQDATDVSKAVVKILAGREIGVGPFTAMTGINVVEGRITLSANLIAAQIKRSGRYNFSVKEHSDLVCVLEFTENGQVVGESSFTMEDAKRIIRRGKSLAEGDNWRNYPRNMLFSRSITNGAKWYCPDVFGGTPVYTPDELDAPVDPQTGEIIQTAVRVIPQDNRYACPKHPGKKWARNEKDGKVWYSHKEPTEKSGWCNMADAPLDTPEHAYVPLEKAAPSPSGAQAKDSPEDWPSRAADDFESRKGRAVAVIEGEYHITLDEAAHAAGLGSWAAVDSNQKLTAVSTAMIALYPKKV